MDRRINAYLVDMIGVNAAAELLQSAEEGCKESQGILRSIENTIVAAEMLALNKGVK